MSRPSGRARICTIFYVLSLTFFFFTVFPAQTWANDDDGLLIKGVLAYFEKMYELNLADGSDRGEDGLLRMRPEVAQSLGLDVYMDENYRNAQSGFAQAKTFLRQAIDAMKTTAEEKKEGEHIANVAHFACLYQRTMHAAVENLKKYRVNLQTEKDDRFDKVKCSDLLRRLFTEGLARNGRNLRDTLGYVYNMCQGIVPLDGYPLTPGNSRFVNYVYNYFLKNAKPLDLSKFDLDKIHSYPNTRRLDFLKKTLGRVARRYLPFLEPILQDYAHDKYRVDPLLFMALMRQESRFDPRSVSQVGAAGITQIMPGTGLLLGMTSIFLPPYLKEARKVMLKERTMKARALRFIQEPEKYCREADARKARRMMQEALSWKKKRKDLYRRYKRELLSHGKDDRLQPKIAIEAGYRLFSELMRQQRGDMSLALAAYNAGSRAVKKYNGLPPYQETVTFRNRVLRYYRQYLNRIGWLLANGRTDG